MDSITGMYAMNFCEYLLKQPPSLPALCAGGETITYAQLVSRAAVYQRRLERSGLQAGARVLLLLAPNMEFYLLLYAMLGAGLVPVLVQKDMPRQQLRSCLKQARLSAMIVAQSAGKYWYLLPELWRVRRFTLDTLRLFTAPLAQAVPEIDGATFCVKALDDEATALLTFTSGSTGTPKGVVRSHPSLLAQCQAMSHFFAHRQQRDVTSFPILTLFSHFHAGCCYLLPTFDAQGRLPVQMIAGAINAQAITRLSVSPAWLKELVDYADVQQCRFPAVREVIIGGAPVTRLLLLAVQRYFPRATCAVNYGASEADPISNVDIDELLEAWDRQPGYLVGRPGPETEILIVRGRDPQPAGEEGEIWVSGPQVLTRYLNNPQAEQLTKIRDLAGRVWHRTGDSGFLDAQQRLWLTGRIADRLRTPSGLTLSPYPVEKQLNGLPGIETSAVVEGPQREICVVLQQAAQCHAAAPLMATLFPGEPVRFWLCAKLPVDARHRSRIDRARLRCLLARRKLKAFFQEV
ncbi:AMP-binding protein [Kosakonia sp. SMBL-WEM22]|uniref:AMP-binding protein n=1 Tax=Kosakonia sp. SMBL-WEM22 TaxID=2725560 RepID=UPI001659CE7E|nr:AMP-binding protein [Kosakonia sp. SMBL-WEM22]QNQ21892.1 AMP-binding protein [Kosakonia sp. SMBL-WEM22]